MPTGLDDVPQFGQANLIFDDVTQRALTISRADRDEIGARLRIVVPFEANGTPVVKMRIVSHQNLCHRL